MFPLPRFEGKEKAKYKKTLKNNTATEKRIGFAENIIRCSDLHLFITQLDGLIRDKVLRVMSSLVLSMLNNILALQPEMTA